MAAQAEAPEGAPDVERVPLAVKLAGAMARAETVIKSSTNTEQGYRYASAEAILGAVREPLLEAGILLTQRPAGVDVEEITSARGTKGQRITVRLDFTFTDGEEDLHVDGWSGQGQDYGDKALGKAYTNALKTFIRAQWLLPTGDDPEATPAGENVGNAPAPGLPGWAAEAADGRKRAFVAAVAELLDGDEEAAKGIARSVANGVGHLPDVAVGLVRGIVATRAGLREPERVAAAQDEAAEAPDLPPSDVTTPEAIEEVRGEEEPPPEPDGERPPAGTVPPPDDLQDLSSDEEREAALRELGCTCADPLGPPRDDSCPIVGHGIPF